MANFMERLIALEIMERVCRMYRYLDHEPSDHLRKRPEPIKTFEVALNSLVGSLETVTDALSDEHLNEWEKIAIHRRLADTFNALDDLHAQLQFLYGTWVRGEAYIFLKKILEFLPVSRQPKNLSIVLSNRYTFEEGDLARHFEIILRGVTPGVELANTTPAVFLPKIERDNPLNWAILAHECGHADSSQILESLESKGIIPRTARSDDIDSLRNWGEELFCDLFATKILGPAYLACFSTFALVAAGGGATESWSETHPSDFVRIFVMKEVLDRQHLHVGFDRELFKQNDLGSLYSYLIYERAKLDRHHIAPVKAAPLEIELEDFVDVVGDVVDEVLALENASPATDFSRVRDLSKRLSSGITIGSCAVNALPFQRELLNKKEGGVFKNAVRETSTSIAEILNAGWLYKVETFLPWMERTVFEEKGSLQDKLADLSAELLKLDGLLIKSIEVSELHRMLEGK